MRCVVSGGSGFIGRHIVACLRRRGHEAETWGRRSLRALEDVANAADAVIHLAGEPVAQRWTPEVKLRIRESRVEGTRRVVDAIASAPEKPRVFLAASAIGYYGDRGDEVLKEDSPPGSGFLADVCREWEAEAERAREFGIRAVRLRIGFVLGKDGGALATMLPAFRFGLGGRLGSGEQWMPWIHVDDLADLFLYAAADKGAAASD